MRVNHQKKYREKGHDFEKKLKKIIEKYQVHASHRISLFVFYL